MMLPAPPKRIGLPLALQMIVILVCALVAAQLVTLLLTMLLPPRPTARWDIDQVVTALGRGEVPSSLERKAMAGPPDISGQGWLVSESSREALAQRLHLGRKDVVLAFYTQLPVGGVAVPTNTHSPLAVMREIRTPDVSSLLIDSADAQSIPGGPPSGGSPGPGGMPGGNFPGGMPPGSNGPRGPGAGGMRPG
ncbi:two-component sensor histidine kinase, partial [Novosphingobium sp. 1949]|nr:two-component sensor histidine kinase [Novosphingobium organovorum]